jgi:very-short-patch-repair endonuclease
MRARELRQPQTPAEERLWRLLRDRRLSGYKFRRQHPIGGFIVDFYCAACHLVVEVDGDSHVVQAEYDRARTDWLVDKGHTVVRFTNHEVHEAPEAVLETIVEYCRRLSKEPSP